MNHWTDILGCYDAELNALADLVGDFDAGSAAKADTWRVAQWRSVAQALGWPQAFEQALETAKGSPAGLASLSEAAVEAFTQWLARRQSGLVELERARVRHQALTALDALGASHGAFFRTNVMSTRLLDSGCYRPVVRDPVAGPGVIGTRSPPNPGAGVITTPSPNKPRAGALPLAAATTAADENAGANDEARGMKLLQALIGVGPTTTSTRARAFHADVAPSYFGDKYPQKPSGCSYPVVLSLGTFPWVYGNVLNREPPGLHWEAGRPWRPAALGMRMLAAMWEPEQNLAQDARLVVAQYQHFRRTTDELLKGLPVWTDDTVGGVGRLYRRRGFLHVHQGSAALVRLNGPRGALAPSAYNYIKRCFAAFFCARRAFVRAIERLPAEARDAFARNPDPCARQLREMAV